MSACFDGVDQSKNGRDPKSVKGKMSYLTLCCACRNDMEISAAVEIFPEPRKPGVDVLPLRSGTLFACKMLGDLDDPNGGRRYPVHDALRRGGRAGTAFFVSELAAGTEHHGGFIIARQRRSGVRSAHTARWTAT